jgi:hypothetical protein
MSSIVSAKMAETLETLSAMAFSALQAEAPESSWVPPQGVTIWRKKHQSECEWLYARAHRVTDDGPPATTVFLVNTGTVDIEYNGASRSRKFEIIESDCVQRSYSRIRPHRGRSHHPWVAMNMW